MVKEVKAREQIILATETITHNPEFGLATNRRKPYHHDKPQRLIVRQCETTTM
jgi:hypothetical protein